MHRPPIYLNAWLLPFSRRRGSLAKQSLIFVAGFSASLCLSVHGEPLRIVVAGDGRADYPWNPPRPCDNEGMNESVTKAISKAVLDENAAILLWTGDMVNLNDTKRGYVEKRSRKVVRHHGAALLESEDMARSRKP